MFTAYNLQQLTTTYSNLQQLTTTYNKLEPFLLELNPACLS